MAPGKWQPAVTWQLPRVDAVLVVLLQRWRFITLTACAIFGAMLLSAVIRGPVYETRASLLVQLGRQASPAAAVNSSQQVIATHRPEDVNNEMQLMQSEVLFEKLVDSYPGKEEYFLKKDPPVTLMQKLKRFASDAKEKVTDAMHSATVAVGLRRQMSPREKVIATLQQSFRGENVNRSDVIEVVVSTRDPDSGRDLLKNFLAIYLQEHIDTFTRPQVREFFESQTQAIKKKLDDATRQQQRLRAQTSAWSPTEQRPRLLDRQQQLRTERATLQSSISGFKAEIAALQKQMEALPAELPVSRTEKRNTLMDKLQEREIEQNIKLAALRERFTDDNQLVIEARHELEMVQAAMKDQKALLVESVTTGLNEQRRAQEGALAVKQAALAGLEAQFARSAAETDSVEQELRSLDTTDAELRRLDREIAQLERDYALYTRSQEEARILEQMDSAKIANVSVIAPPAGGFTPVSPSLKVLVLGGLVAGLGAPIGWVLLRDRLRPTVRSRTDLSELLGVPVVARIQEHSGV